jgi:Cysteine-rich CPCC
MSDVLLWTDKAITKLPFNDDGQHTVRDVELKGLFARVGKRTKIYMVQDEHWRDGFREFAGQKKARRVWGRFWVRRAIEGKGGIHRVYPRRTTRIVVAGRPCCCSRTLSGRGHFEICEVCYWENDGQNDADADADVVCGGPNSDLSLTIARANYGAQRVSNPLHSASVRRPTPPPSHRHSPSRIATTNRRGSRCRSLVRRMHPRPSACVWRFCRRIPDDYAFMGPELVALLRKNVTPHLRQSSLI